MRSFHWHRRPREHLPGVSCHQCCPRRYRKVWKGEWDRPLQVGTARLNAAHGSVVTECPNRERNMFESTNIVWDEPGDRQSLASAYRWSTTSEILVAAGNQLWDGVLTYTGLCTRFIPIQFENCSHWSVGNIMTDELIWHSIRGG